MAGSTAQTVSVPPRRRSELIVRPWGERGDHVVKDPRTGQYFRFGERESFLLTSLDGRQTAPAICRAYQSRFGEPFSEDDLDQFLTVVESGGLLAPRDLIDQEPCGEPDEAQRRWEAARPFAQGSDLSSRVAAHDGQSLLYWRRKIFDPDRLFDWLLPRLWFLWTRAFLLLSAGAIFLAVLIAWANSAQLVTKFTQSLHWGTILSAWLTLFAVTTCHEFA